GAEPAAAAEEPAREAVTLPGPASAGLWIVVNPGVLPTTQGALRDVPPPRVRCATLGFVIRPRWGRAGNPGSRTRAPWDTAIAAHRDPSALIPPLATTDRTET